jgi:hypothetical protein
MPASLSNGSAAHAIAEIEADFWRDIRERRAQLSEVDQQWFDTELQHAINLLFITAR